MLLVNENEVSFQAGMTLADLVRAQGDDVDILLVNGYPATLQTVLSDGDQCWLWKRGKTPSAEEMQHLLYARHSPGVQRLLQGKMVGIMGLGGLGSVVAIALARMGIGALLLADYDVVEPTNLNRQQYFVDQVGQKKTAALRDILQRVNPHVGVTVIDQRLIEDDIGVLFKKVHALVECFDDPAMKAAGLRAVLQHLPGVFYVCASGLAGYGDNNAIRTRRLYSGVYLVGDEVSAAAPGEGLMAARVGIAAHHQANQVVRLLLGAENEAAE
ncbi:MAG: sulfur carrier protein ThiS adenylyltransferase ThiF [Proteobacteria bacterium]|nr:sulfur carrier protein ThiS adenylyltransferase ThiF [Pseudomonadota bacterium]